MGLKMIVLDASTLTKLGIINTYSMIQYTRRFNTVGEFNLTCALSQENTELLKRDRVLWIEDTVGGFVNYVFKDRDNNNLQVKGFLMVGMLKLRSIYPSVDMYDLPENILYSLVSTFCMTGKRKFYKLALGDKQIKNTAKVRYQQTGENVADEAEVLATTYDFGFDVDLVIEDDETQGTIRKYVFHTMVGKDRTLGNGVNKTVLLGTDFNNILSSTYTMDASAERNYAIVAGEGEGGQRKYEQLYTTATEPEDFGRREVFLDARDLQSKNDDVELTDAQYRELLRSRGRERLESDYQLRESYESELRSDLKAEYIYGRDFDLGDKVTVIDKELSLRLDAVVSGVTVTEYGKGRIVEPILGYQMPTVYQWIKKGVL